MIRICSQNRPTSREQGFSCLVRGFLALLAFALVAVSSVRLSATIVKITFFDQANVNPEFAGGPLWTGFVDTTTDNLTIETWTELPLHGSEFWAPQTLPLVWPARTSTGALFDVPDTFNGSIDNSFGFISDVSLQDMAWLRPTLNTSTDPPTLDFAPADYTLDTGDVWPGWGAFALQRNVGGQIVKVFETANPNEDEQDQPPFDERIMPALPVQPFLDKPPSYVAASEAIVTAVVMPPVAQPIPEAAAWRTVGLVTLLALAGHAYARIARRQVQIARVAKVDRC
ncbi:MAG: hypothetical protein KDA44_15450 [Planctomycetales bacterium]|nr:hypothetical protein [Planctomycetales bacterium]